MNVELSDFFHECGIRDEKNFIASCEKLREFLIEENNHVNLTRLTSEEDFYLKHVADSLLIARFFPEISAEKLALADIGCGAGFPSLILALAFPALSVTSIDSAGKKINFVRNAADLLGLKNLNAIHGRSVELNCKPEFQDKFDIVTARAVAPSPKIYREANRFPRKNGRFIFYKTPTQAAEELPQLTALKNISWQNTGVYSLPCNAGERLFTVGCSGKASDSKKNKYL